VEQGEAAARSPTGGTPGAADGALSAEKSKRNEWVTEKWIWKGNVRKEIRFRGGTRPYFFYHVAPSGASDVGL
jgi:hypothetical protein